MQWFRDRAQMLRWQEEIEIIEEEFRRTIRTYEHMADLWTTLATSHDVGGYSAYAFKQAHMYCQMASDCHTKFTAVGGMWPDGRTLSDLITEQRKARGTIQY